MTIANAEHSPLPGAPRTLATEVAEAVYRLAPDGMMLLQDGVFVECNPGASAVLGHDLRSLIGGGADLISYPVQADGRAWSEHVVERNAQAERDGFARFEWLARRSDGSPVRILVTMISARVGGKDSSIVLMQDLTETAAVVDRIMRGLGQMAQGDFLSRIDERFLDEYEPLRNSFNDTVRSVGEAMEIVADVASQVQAGSGEIHSATNDLANRTERQAASLEETARALGRVTKAVEGTALDAARVSRTMEDAEREAASGGQIVEQASQAMRAIEKSAREITKIIGVINTIAIQTKLLSLNAGVEAARAGDAGRGFAVVASEVRALSQRSAEAVNEVEQLIGTTAERVKEGVALVERTGATLRDIVGRVSDVHRAIDAISQSADVQADDLRHVNTAMSDMDRMTAQNAALVEESTAAARSLADQAEDLSELVTRFTTPSKRARQPVTQPVPMRRRA